MVNTFYLLTSDGLEIHIQPNLPTSVIDYILLVNITTKTLRSLAI